MEKATCSRGNTGRVTCSVNPALGQCRLLPCRSHPEAPESPWGWRSPYSFFLQLWWNQMSS